MAVQRNPDLWLENIGEILLDEGDKFVWMLPEVFVSTHTGLLASPYFRFDQENWRLVMKAKSCTSFDLFLWVKWCKTLKEKYTIWLNIKTYGEDYYHSGQLNPYYGFGHSHQINRNNYFTQLDIQNGLIKICCRIRRIEDDARDMLLCSVSETEKDKNETECTNDKDEEKESELKGVDRLLQNFGDLLHNEWGSDVILKTKDHEFHAHRIIIGARSPVFSSMFQHDMAEKKTGEVDISDCSTAGFKVFLQYLYTGKADTMSSDNVLDLYYIADKYQVGDLKAECVEYIKNALSVDNLCDVITLSLKHSESDLQNLATLFFCRNIKNIVKTVQWQKFISENPIAANELYIKAINA